MKSMHDESNTVLVTGGAGYVGAALVPALLAAGYHVKVLDLYLYGEDVFGPVRHDPRLTEIKGDIRDCDLLRAILPGCDAVIHLACISNDPCFELDPELGRSINYECFADLVDLAKDSGVRRFIYASSSSVYGIKHEHHVTEELPLEPLTHYSRYKALCEDILLGKRGPGFETVIVRPATVCGYSPRLRLDLTVNILTKDAVVKRAITIFGGEQKRPNIHIQDMVRVYEELLRQPRARVDGEIFNAGYENHTINELADMVRVRVGSDVVLTKQASTDTRSYHISSEKLARTIGFRPARSIEDAVDELKTILSEPRMQRSLDDSRYYNIRRMKEVALV